MRKVSSARDSLHVVRKWVLAPRQCPRAVAKISRGTWRPWVRVLAKPTPFVDCYVISLPGGTCRIEVVRGGHNASLNVASHYGSAWRLMVSAHEARYRVLRAAIGSVAEAGLVPARDVERLWVALETAAGQVEIARAA